VPIFTRYTLAFALQLREKHSKTAVTVAEECQFAKSVQNRVSTNDCHRARIIASSAYSTKEY